MFGAFLARQSAAQPSQARQPSPAQPSPAHSPAQPSTAQLVHPSLGVGLAKALPKAFSYRIWPVSGRPAAAFPCLAPGQASPAQARSAQPSPPQPGPSLGAGLAERFAKAFLTGFRGPIFGRETAPFLVCFWPVWGRRAAAFGCFGGSMFGAFLARQSAAQPSQARQAMPRPSPGLAESSLAVGLSPAQPTPSPPNPGQASRSLAEALCSPHQPSPAARPVQARPALPKLCQRLCFTGFRGPIIGHANAPFFLVAF